MLFVVVAIQHVIRNLFFREPGVVVHVCSPSTWKAEARESRVGGQHGLVIPCLKKTKIKTKKRNLFSRRKT
jgi:hypothetical protein